MEKDNSYTLDVRNKSKNQLENTVDINLQVNKDIKTIAVLDFEAVKHTIFENDISVIFHFAGFSNINKVKASPRECINLNILGINYEQSYFFVGNNSIHNSINFIMYYF